MKELYFGLVSVNFL